MKAPSVVARPVAEARLLLEEAGVRVASISETAPPGGSPAGPMRVVQERQTEEGVQLVTAASIVLAESYDTSI